MTTPVNDPFAELEARKAEQSDEYGTYAASRRVDVGASLAYDLGHPIPASNVQPDGSVVTLRHYCPPQLPGQPECTIENNTVLQTTEPGVAIKVNAPRAKSSAKSSDSTTKKES